MQHRTRRALLLPEKNDLGACFFGAHWHEVLGAPTIADAIMDCLMPSSLRVEMNGKSVRKGKAKYDEPSSADQRTPKTPKTKPDTTKFVMRNLASC